MKKEDFLIKVEVIKDFTYNDFSKIKELERRTAKDKDGWLYIGDTFCCSKDIAEYLTGKNDKEIVVVKVIEVIPK